MRVFQAGVLHKEQAGLKHSYILLGKVYLLITNWRSYSRNKEEYLNF